MTPRLGLAVLYLLPAALVAHLFHSERLAEWVQKRVASA